MNAAAIGFSVSFGSSWSDTPRAAAEVAALHVERIDGRRLAAHTIAWADLCTRTLEQNVFLEPAFAVPLLQHVSSARRPDFLLVWEEDGSTSFGRLVGLMPVVLPHFSRHGVARGFHHKQVSLGTPLLDRDRAEAAFAAMLAWMSAKAPEAGALLLSGIEVDGAFASMLSTGCADRRIQLLDAHSRAVLPRPAVGVAAVLSLASAKKRKELARQRRRLSEKGQRTYSSARTPDEIAHATERFLALEHGGWKGGRGTALLADPTLATFTRAMTRMMAHEGKCRIDSIEIDGRPVAMGIILTVRERAYFWKTSFDESYAQLSPGVQFALELTSAQLADPAIALTDSCAVPDHPMIDRLWPARMGVTDLVIELAPASPRRFHRAVRAECWTRALRARVKALRVRLRLAKGS